MLLSTLALKGSTRSWTAPSTWYRSCSAQLSFSSSTSNAIKQMPPRPTLPDSDVEHVYLKGSGPGGQKINKTSSAVQMRHLPTGIVVKSQATRSQSQNYKIARQILASKIEEMEKGDDSRAAKVRETKIARKSSKMKKSKRKYRALAEKALEDQKLEDQLEETGDPSNGSQEEIS